MKSILLFIRTTLTGGILFLLPMVLLIMVVNKAHQILEKVSAPLAERLPDIFFGWDGSGIVAILLLIILCFISGLLFRSALVKRWISKLEENVLSYLPGYSMIKSITADAVGEKIEQSLTPVLAQDGEYWKIGFLVEEVDGFCTIFFPDAPRHDSGEVKIMPVSFIKRLSVHSHVVTRSLKSYGKGALHWVKMV